MISKSMSVTIAPMITAIVGMIAQSNPQFDWITEEMIYSLLAMFGISAGVGAKVKSDKRKSIVELTKLEIARKELEYKQTELEKAQETIRLPNDHIIEEKHYTPVNKVRETFKKIRKEEYDTYTPLQKDRFNQSGGVVDLFAKSKGNVQWNNMGADFDHTLEHDEDRGAVFRFGTQYLYVKVRDAKHGHTVVLEDDQGNRLLVDQKPENSTTCLVMKDRRGQPLSRGSYKLIITAMGLKTSYTNTFTTEFDII